MTASKSIGWTAAAVYWNYFYLKRIDMYRMHLYFYEHEYVTLVQCSVSTVILNISHAQCMYFVPEKYNVHVKLLACTCRYLCCADTCVWLLQVVYTTVQQENSLLDLSPGRGGGAGADITNSSSLQAMSDPWGPSSAQAPVNSARFCCCM